MNGSQDWWKLDSAAIFERLDSSEKGLTSASAKDRLLKYGSNLLGGQKPPSPLSILFAQLKNWLVVMLLGAACISFFLGESLDGVVIIVLVTLSVLFGFYQEFKAEKVITDLKKFITNKAKVLRDDKWQEIDAVNMVPGDIVEMRIGDKISADIRLINVDNFSIDESALTGESLPVSKTMEIINTDSANPTELKNMAFMGTLVSEGRGVGIVVATGEETFFGKNAKTLEAPEPETDFQKQIRNFSLLLFRVVIIMTLFIFATNALLKKDVLESFLFALALAVGITPEMLPAIITVTLSQGALKMARKKVVVKRLISVEDFGNVDTLCTDKTGTLTEGKFALDSYINLNDVNDKEVLTKGTLCTAGFFENSQNAIISPVDNAILESQFVKDIDKEIKGYTLLDENVFDYDRKRMSVLIKQGKSNLLVVKGAYESVLEISEYASVEGKKVKITDKVRSVINELIEKYESKSYRIIAVAEKDLSKDKSDKSDESGMLLIGFLLFKDPIKASAKDAIKLFRQLGVSLKVLSGDSLTVTRNIAKEAGIEFTDEEILSGEDLEKMSEAEFNNCCKKVNIFARVTPDQKYRIVHSLNYEGHVVAYMGDGVNDVAALRAADVGISVDTGVDIAKDASDIILLEKDLKILSEGILSGRKTFGNILKYILNTISANYGNMFTVAAASLFLKFIPLLPSQILLNNFISDIPLFAVATDNVDNNFVRKPKRWNLTYIKNFMIFFGFVSSIFDMILILPMIFILHVSPEVFRTAWFVESSISEMIITFAIRTKMPFYKSSPSRWLLWLSIVSIIVVISMPLLQISVFSFVNLPLIVWGLIITDLISYFILVEIVKKSFFEKFEGNKNTK